MASSAALARRTRVPTPMPNPSGKSKARNRVPQEQDREREDQVEEQPVDVLEDEREAALALVAAPGVRYRAGRRRPEERPVVGLPVVVAGEPETERERAGPASAGDRVEPVPEERHRGVGAARGQARRVERRQVRLDVVVGVHEGGPGGVDGEGAEDDHGDEGLHPPAVPAECPRRVDRDRYGTCVPCRGGHSRGCSLSSEGAGWSWPRRIVRRHAFHRRRAESSSSGRILSAFS